MATSLYAVYRRLDDLAKQPDVFIMANKNWATSLNL